MIFLKVIGLIGNSLSVGTLIVGSSVWAHFCARSIINIFFLECYFCYSSSVINAFPMLNKTLRNMQIVRKLAERTLTFTIFLSLQFDEISWSSLSRRMSQNLLLTKYSTTSAGEFRRNHYLCRSQHRTDNRNHNMKSKVLEHTPHWEYKIRISFFLNSWWQR